MKLHPIGTVGIKPVILMVTLSVCAPYKSLTAVAIVRTVSSVKNDLFVKSGNSVDLWLSNSYGDPMMSPMTAPSMNVSLYRLFSHTVSVQLPSFEALVAR